MRPAMAMLASLASAAVALVSAECERVPPEDFAAHGGPAASAAPASLAPAPSSTEAGDGGAPERRVVLHVPSAEDEASSGDAARCVQPTPSDPPPPVPPGPAVGCPPDPEGGPGRLPVVHLGFPDKKGVSVEAELVRSEHDTMRGLMYRKSLGADKGMLFDLGVRDDHKFWMHNTCVPLDLLYVDADGLIVGIVENAPTLDDTSRGVGCPSRWVLEVNAGWSRRHGVKAGQHVALP
ncbi:MAG TPA: DUF192 domain-containing protein [Polyangiaceae bacterium]|jgi:hypothetical protein|nr:DUF192 domain-containing protein [Polyangiaceae bacterium]